LIIPHQPRLDWMIWFVPTQQPIQMNWFGSFLERLQTNPFPTTPPRYLRVDSFKYRFTTAEERAQTGHWWQMEVSGILPSGYTEDSLTRLIGNVDKLFNYMNKSMRARRTHKFQLMV
jgi:hypothetical protein